MKALPILIRELFSASFVAEEDNSLELAMNSAKIIEPSPITFSFNTPAWYFTGIVILIIAIVLFVRWLIKYHSNAYRREAIRELNKYELIEKPQLLIEVLSILKLVAIKSYGRNQVAVLSGNEWFQFLESSSNKTSFSEIKEDVLLALYKNESLDKIVSNKLLSTSKSWISTHA